MNKMCGLLLIKTFKLIWRAGLLTVSLLDVVFSGCASCELNYISTKNVCFYSNLQSSSSHSYRFVESVIINKR